ncbi:transposase, partial [Megasphaera sp.]
MGFTLLSWQRLRNNNPPAMRVGANSYTKKSPFHYNRGVQATITLKGKVIYMAKKANDLAHTKWLCKYHIVFTPKYRRKIIFNQYRRDLGEILRQ